jgi:hypothetical protein
MRFSTLSAILAAVFALHSSDGRAAPGPEAVCSQSSTIFCSGFEEGNFSLFDDFDGNPAPWNTLRADPGPLNLADNHITRMRVPPGRGVTDLIKVLPQTQDKVYVRWYQRWETGYDFTAGNHGGGPHAGDRNLLGHSDFRPTGADWFSAWLEPERGRLTLYTYYRGMYQDCANPSGSCWGDHFPCFLDEGGSGYCQKAEHRETVMPPLVQTNRWYCIELMMDAGTPVTSDAQADGSMNLWIDNTEYGPFNHLWFRTTPNLKITLVNLGVFHTDEHAVEGTEYDNYVISKTRIGCAAPGGVKPKPPTDVRTN